MEPFVEQSVHDSPTGPNVHRFAVVVLARLLRGHIDKSPASFGYFLEIRSLIDCCEAKIDDL